MSSAPAVRDGKVVRRSLRDVERYIGRDAFVGRGAPARFPGGGERGPDGHLLQRKNPCGSCATPFSPAKTQFFGKAGFSDVGIAENSGDPSPPDTRNRIPSRARPSGTPPAPDRPRPPFEPEPPQQEREQKWPLHHREPRPGTDPRPGGKRDEGLPLTHPCHSPSPSAPDRTRRDCPKAACAGADATARSPPARPWAPAGRETSPPAMSPAPSSEPGDRAAAPRETRRASHRAARCPRPWRIRQARHLSATRSCHSG
jgi:hypothetical protein